MTTSRMATPTVGFVDEYCALYQDAFPDVRSFEQFKLLHVGLLADLPRKSLPAIANAVGTTDAQALHHFLSASPWSVQAVRERRLKGIQQLVGERPLTLCIDETGDRKKGKTTDYVARQYLGNVGKVDNGVVSVNLYGVLENVTIPLAFAVFKPTTQLKPTDTYRSKPQLALELLQELLAYGFTFNLGLADALYGESGPFVQTLEALKLPYIVAIRRDHGMLLPPGQRVRANLWRPFARHFTDGSTQQRYVREWIYGVRRSIRFFELTTDPETLPSETTQMVMTNLAGPLGRTLGDRYGLRTWIEAAFKQAKQALGWADYRLTSYAAIERWWELVMSAFWLVSLQTLQWTTAQADPARAAPDPLPHHPNWTSGRNWAQVLTNLRLVVHPFVYYAWLLPWIHLLHLSHLQQDFHTLLAAMNQFHALLPI